MDIFTEAYILICTINWFSTCFSLYVNDNQLFDIIVQENSCNNLCANVGSNVQDFSCFQNQKKSKSIPILHVEFLILSSLVCQVIMEGFVGNNVILTISFKKS